MKTDLSIIVPIFNEEKNIFISVFDTYKKHYGKYFAILKKRF